MVMVYNVEDLGSPHTSERLAVHQNRLNELAIEGWELVAIAGSVGYFRRDSADAGKPPVSQAESPAEKPADAPETESGTARSEDSESRENRNPEGGRRGSGRHGRHG